MVLVLGARQLRAVILRMRLLLLLLLPGLVLLLLLLVPGLVLLLHTRGTIVRWVVVLLPLVLLLLLLLRRMLLLPLLRAIGTSCSANVIAITAVATFSIALRDGHRFFADLFIDS